MKRLHLDHLVDIERAVEHQVRHGSDLARGAVLERQHGHVGLPCLAGLVGLLETGTGHQFRAGVQTRGSDIGESAGDPAVGHAQAGIEPALPVAGKGDQFLLERHIILADVAVLDALRAAQDDALLAGGVGDAQAVRLLVGGNPADEFHPPLE